MKLKIKKGYDIPIKGYPESFDISESESEHVGLDLRAFSFHKTVPLVKEGQFVKTGEPIAQHGDFKTSFIVSPSSGYVESIERGPKRRLLSIGIKKEAEDSFFEHPEINEKIDEKNIAFFLASRGLLSHFSSRPFGTNPNPDVLPEKIFINFAENSPFFPSYSQQIKCLDPSVSFTNVLDEGIKLIRLLTKSKPELIYRKEHENFLSQCIKQKCNVHLIKGPYPSGEASVHIHKISPITSLKNVIWTINFYDVLILGYMFLTGRYLNKKIITLSGTGFDLKDRLFKKVNSGINIRDLIAKKYFSEERLIATGSPLTGRKITGTKKEFLGFRDFNVSCFQINLERELFSFMRLGFNKFTITNTYLYKLFHKKSSPFNFTTNMHGEHRSFIDADLYNKYMPMKIPVIPLIKAILSENFELAIRLGFLEIIPEDFALSTFVCPSKNELIDIVRNGIHNFMSQES